MKVALVCDWLTEVGGAEQVLLKLHKMYPKAPIYTSQYRKSRIDWFEKTKIHTGWLNYLPVFTRRFIAPLRQNYFKNLNLTGYDLVISVTGCDAKYVKTDGIHLCYCHVPTQYYWSKYDEYLKNPGFGFLNPLVRNIFKKVAPNLQQKDLESAMCPDYYVTISKYAKSEIKKYYKREAKVINPPVNTKTFSQVVENYATKKGKSQIKKAHNKTIKKQISQADKTEQIFCTTNKIVENSEVLRDLIEKYPDSFYINFSRQVNWKNLDLAIKACKKLKLPLVLVGNGPENKNLKKLAEDSENITFLDSLSQKELAVLAHFSRGFIFPSEEPFGIAPLEAISAGCPVIALKKGGALDYIKEEKNGVFFDSLSVSSLIKTLEKFEKMRKSNQKHPTLPLFNREKVSKTAEKYSDQNFAKNMKGYIREIRKRR